MSKNIFYFLTAIALASSATSTSAATPVTVATVPDGMVTLPILHGATNYLSLPLTRVSAYTTTVSAVTTNTLSVDDTPAPFTSTLLVPGKPYFVRFLSGNEVGRVMLITNSSANSLTVDTTDHISGEAVALTSTGFSVQAGDTFEIFPGDTLASVFGDGSSANPLAVTGGANSTSADVVSLYTTLAATPSTYYYNTLTRHWELNGTTTNANNTFISPVRWELNGAATNANNTIIYPYSAFSVLRRSNHADTTLTLGGRVTQVAPTTKLVSGGSVYTSTHFATDIKLSQLQFASNWVQGATAFAADTIGIWNSTLSKFDTYYQMTDSTWRKFPDMVTDQSNITIPAGTVATITKKAPVAGVATFLESSLPYSLE